jgi:large subunit ribosomal protein L2
MPNRKFNPLTPSLRFTTVSTFEEITKSKPERSLVKAKKNSAGRNSAGRITVRHRGGGHKRKIRTLDFRREKAGIPARVAAIEYDPNRSANIALLHYADGDKRYILAPLGIGVGATLLSGPEADAVEGNALPLRRIPLGVSIHCVELRPGGGGAIVRSAGNAATLMSRDEDRATVKLPSGEIRILHVNCMATVGRVGNPDHSGRSDGKAGRKRWKGVRPTVRGVVMNPVDHPMGGGEGRSSGGGHPVSPWGKLAKGGKTRSKKNPSSKFIVKRRK